MARPQPLRRTVRADNGGVTAKDAWVGDIESITEDNATFRTVLWTGTNLQLTVMCLATGEEVGLEMHDHLDQFIRVESGAARVTLGPSADEIDVAHEIADDWAMIIPAGTWHNVVNTGSQPLRLYSVYAPPEHADGAVQRTKAEADEATHHT